MKGCDTPELGNQFIVCSLLNRGATCRFESLFTSPARPGSPVSDVGQTVTDGDA